MERGSGGERGLFEAPVGGASERPPGDHGIF